MVLSWKCERNLPHLLPYQRRHPPPINDGEDPRLPREVTRVGDQVIILAVGEEAVVDRPIDHEALLLITIEAAAAAAAAEEDEALVPVFHHRHSHHRHRTEEEEAEVSVDKKERVFFAILPWR